MLFQKTKVNSLELNNRIVMPPMATHRLQAGEKINEDIIAYYVDRARGSYLGLMETEYTYINVQGRAGLSQMPIDSDDCIEQLKKLTDAVHRVGSTKFFIQINHAGGYSKPLEGMDVVAPSEFEYNMGKYTQIAKQLSKSQIKGIVNEFAQAARRAKEAGFDGVEIHGAHGYLLSQFLSPITNQRNDEYGGSIENRTRIYTEVIQAVREIVGNDFPISVRLGVVDKQNNGICLEDAVIAAKLIEEASADMISVSGGLGGYIIPGHLEPGYFKNEAKAIKQVVSIPIMMAGGITSLGFAEELIRDGYIDLAGIGRKLFVDADFIKKELNEKN